MKYQVLLGVALFSLSGSLLAAESLCEQKEQDIQREIGMAQKHNNQRRVNGLERALTEVRADCSDKSSRPPIWKELTLRSRKLLSVSTHSGKSVKRAMTRRRLLSDNKNWMKRAGS